MHLVLVPSPLLGPATWSPVVDRLRERGHDATHVPLVRRTVAGVLDAVVGAAGGDGPVVLVPHSNAGLYAPRLGELVHVSATVYVDAALPTGSPDTALAPAGFLDFLRGLADDDGLLPPWTAWWDDTDGLFPDDAARAAVAAEQPRLPLSYFTQRVPVPAGWANRPAAYLGFGDTYAEELAFARGRGWPVSTMPGGHLHALHEPAAVADEVLRLARSLTA
ncbi:alpha/beta fold hydrolase [Nocardioides lijunqiniae]|uniref:alpha/beta fold hydrolase n=1 Tax=Nocardioides lijunqiniae TaxID=2760832 RepID=UPI00187880ED|nr:alpha/beta fold hydrolase [Nocardioides lijunqiniae]